jgi:hypothetical protein
MNVKYNIIIIMKRAIPIQINDECIKLYEESLINKETDSQINKKIQEYLIKNEISVSSRTIYNYMDEWKRNSTISSVMQSFEVDLSWQTTMTKEITDRLFKRFINADNNSKSLSREIQEWARLTKEYIDLSVKIDILKSKRNTVIKTDDKEEAGRIVLAQQIDSNLD